MASKVGKLSEIERKRNGFCRYFAKGDCREGNDCKFSHSPDDIPVCRYYLEDRCHFGSSCWFRHPCPESDMFDMSPMAAIIGSGLMCSINPNMNLLLAAAIAGAPTPGQEEKEDSEDEKEKEEISLEKVLEIWKKFQSRDENNNDSNKSNASEQYSSFEEEEQHLQEFSQELKQYSLKSWSPDDIFTLITNLTKVDVKDYDEYDFLTSKILGDALRLWKPDPHHAAFLIMMIVEKCEADLMSLILTVCNAPERVHSLEKHIACTVLEAQKNDPMKWNSEAIGILLQKIEENGFNVDAIEFFHSVGKDIKDAEKLGELVHDYLVATGEKDSFDCRCKTAECQCPVEADEGVAFIMFSGLQRKLEWNEEDKVKFFRKATDNLWKPELLAELGESFGVKEPLKISTPRTLKKHKKIQEVSEQEAKQITEETTKTGQTSKSRKCKGKGCPNQKKKDCDNDMCGRCCRNSGEACDVHEDSFDVYFPPSYESNHKFHKVEPSAHFENRKKFEEFISVKKPRLRRLSFGSDFSVTDDDLVKVVDLWGDNLVVLELGSSDTGCGSHLTDTSVQHLAAHCPNLCKLRLESATRVTDKAMIDIIKKCPLLEELHISGNDKISGNLTDKTMKLLFEDGALPNLRQICVTDQGAIEPSTVYRLRRRCPKLRIIAGETDSDSFAHSMVLSMMGLDYGDGLF